MRVSVIGAEQGAMTGPIKRGRRTVGLRSDNSRRLAEPSDIIERLANRKNGALFWRVGFLRFGQHGISFTFILSIRNKANENGHCGADEECRDAQMARKRTLPRVEPLLE